MIAWILLTYLDNFMLFKQNQFNYNFIFVKYYSIYWVQVFIGGKGETELNFANDLRVDWFYTFSIIPIFLESESTALTFSFKLYESFALGCIVILEYDNILLFI